MDFTNPRVFLESSLQTSKKNAYDIITLPEGSTVYRADRGGARDPSEGVPIFFSDKQSISTYGGTDEANVSSYTTTKPAKLFVLSYINIIRILADKTIPENVKEFISTSYMKRAELTEEEWEKLKTQGFPAKEGASMPKGIPFIIPAQPIAQSGKYLVYTNRLFAETVCKLGFDGWMALPYTLVQRNLDSSFYSQNQAQLPKDMVAGTVRYKYNMYAPEIVLCNWKASSSRKSGGTRRKALHRKKTLRRRQK